MTVSHPARRILLIRLSAIGDVVMATPLIGALRRAYPDARLAWLVEPAAAGLLRHHPDLDEVIVWPRDDWRALIRERRYAAWLRAVRGFIAGLRRRRFDLVIDAQGLLKSALWARLSGARVRIGLNAKEGSRLLMTEVVRDDSDGTRIGSEYLKLAQQLGLDPGTFTMDLVLGQADDAWARDFARELGPYVVFCPFTTRPQKHWFEERWVDLAEAVKTRFDLTPVVLGGPQDRAAAARIQAASPLIINHAGALPLAQSAALIKHATGLVGVDTGLTHMGIAFGIPTVCLFGSTRPYIDTTRANAKVMYEPLECAPCRRRPTCGGLYTCMRLLEAGKVADTLEGLLGDEAVEP